MSWLLVIAGIFGFALAVFLLTKIPLLFQLVKHGLGHVLDHLMEPLVVTEWFPYMLAAVLWFAILAVIVAVIAIAIYFLP